MERSAPGGSSPRTSNLKRLDGRPAAQRDCTPPKADFDQPIVDVHAASKNAEFLEVSSNSSEVFDAYLRAAQEKQFVEIALDDAPLASARDLGARSSTPVPSIASASPALTAAAPAQAQPAAPVWAQDDPAIQEGFAPPTAGLRPGVRNGLLTGSAIIGTGTLTVLAISLFSLNDGIAVPTAIPISMGVFAATSVIGHLVVRFFTYRVSLRD